MLTSAGQGRFESSPGSFSVAFMPDLLPMTMVFIGMRLWGQEQERNQVRHLLDTDGPAATFTAWCLNPKPLGSTSHRPSSSGNFGGRSRCELMPPRKNHSGKPADWMDAHHPSR